MRTWRSAPWATSVTAWAISPTARPASSDVAAICCDADDTVWVPRATSPMSSRRLLVMPAIALPSTSRSDCGCTSTVRSPSATREAASPMPLTYSIMRPNAAAIAPISSRLVTVTCWSRSPSAMPSAARSTWPMPPTRRRLISVAMKPPATSAKMIRNISVLRTPWPVAAIPLSSFFAWSMLTWPSSPSVPSTSAYSGAAVSK